MTEQPTLSDTLTDSDTLPSTPPPVDQLQQIVNMLVSCVSFEPHDDWEPRETTGQGEDAGGAPT